jgi:RNA polymerase sigma-70 factor, ECF subfamily
MPTTPASLLARLRDPAAEDAWDRFVELYTPLLFHWAREAGLQESDAADLVQDVFILLMRKLPEFHYDRNKGFRAWLRTVAVNRLRETRRRPALSQMDGQFDDMPDPATNEPFWEGDYRRHVTSRALQVMRRDFDASTWQAFWACVVEGQSAADCGRLLGLTPGAVRAAKFRVLYRLRRELDGLMD